MAYEEPLQTAGLTHDQAALYEVLIKNGPLPASKAAQHATISRTLSYKVFDELTEKGLVEKKEEKGKVAVFQAVHPMKLKEIIDEQARRAEDAKGALQTVLTHLVSDYNTVSGQPGVRMLEGIRGITELYKDILDEQKNICLIRSPDDDKFPELADLVEKQIRDQVRLGIKTRAITPLVPETSETVLAYDAVRLVERRIIPLEKFQTPAQIILYAQKVALTSYDQALMTTIIENAAISATFTTLFEYIWTMATPEHERIRANMTL